MVSKIHSYGLLGIDAYPIEIEVDISRGLPAVNIVGLPDNAIKESKERTRSAIKNSGFDYPAERITVSLAPADMKKEGPSFDLPIALGLLAASNQINKENLQKYVILGEVALDGKIRPIKGVLPVAVAMAASTRKNIILPRENAQEASTVSKINVFAVNSLTEVVNFLNEVENIAPFKISRQKIFSQALNYEVDFSEVKGQVLAKRALEVAVAGGHNLLMIGPPGSGKTMLAKRIPTIIPDMDLEEALETTKVHSVMGLVAPEKGIVATRPFRSPHHTISDIAMVGGGSNPQPGEISLAHNGVLFLDELPEFHRDVLEVLRQPLEDGFVRISRAAKSLNFPAKFMLVCAMNPCPCGYFTDPKKECRCSPNQIHKYIGKISGPLLDRIDIHIDVPSLKYKELASDAEAEPSLKIKQRIENARKIQKQRFKTEGIYSNAQMNHRQIKKYCSLNDEGKELLKMAINELGFSARAYDKILKVGRTIADLVESLNILPEHLSEAIQYRSLDRNIWA